MGALQPGLPAPTMIPQGWNIVVIDLKDCFFIIPLHPQDTQHFAFTLPSDKFERARHSHEIFHQNARALYRQFQISLNDAKGIVCACPQCSHHGPGLG
ncbi:POK25 protein, partial [Erythrocercus mccallii]|nr:POK25 protein [Erythrocercus mccallii]